MKPERWQQIEQFYHAALERAPEERAAFLDTACADSSMRQEVKSLLAYDERAERFITTPPDEIAAEMLAAEQAPSLIGSSLSHYRILSRLGRGGMGEVYLATDTQLDRKVAIKLLPSEFTADAERVRRFKQEARAASALNHPNIITIHEIGEVDHRHFIISEFVEGETLRQRMRSYRMDQAAALEIVVQVASALAAAHAAGIVHRDIKPENVMVRPDGLVKVLDFGLAKLTETQASTVDSQASTLAGMNTETGVVMGTARYMSPEQARGQKVDARTDIFSLGVVLYEVLAGCAPFAGASASDVIAAILTTEPAPLSQHLPEAAPELERIVNKALRKDREWRYQAVKDLLVDLKSFKQEFELEAKSGRADRGKADAAAHATSNAKYLLSQIKRHKHGVILTVATLVVVGAGIASWLSQLIGQQKPAAPFQAMEIRRLTHTGKATQAAISPDGKYVVYAIENAGLQSLWVRQVATSSDEQIVPPAEVDYNGITFSRDGNFIYYVRKEQNAVTGTLYRKPVLGGAEKKLFVNVDSPITLSPDGVRLAFVRVIQPHWEHLLMVANIDGAEEKILTTRKSPDFFSQRGPAWSPDGKLIACGLLNFSGSFYASVVGVSVEDGVERLLTAQRWSVPEGRQGAVSSIGRVAWLSDGGGLIVTVSKHEGSPPQIWGLSYPQGVARKITADLNDYADVSLTANSQSLAAVRFERLINIWIAPGGDASLAKQVTSGSGREDGVRGLAWTPDGRILYRSIAGGHPDIWLMTADGGGNRQLSAGARNNVDLAVSSDGRYVVWGSNRTGIFNIWRMELDGSNPKQLTHSSGEWFPLYSPDGNWLVYRAYSAGLVNSLWKLPLDGGAPVRLTDNIGWMPSISPDGKLIACNYLSGPGAKWQIAIIPFEGGQPRFIEFLDPSYHRPVRWTSDGRAVAYPVTRGSISNLWAQPLDGGPQKQLTDFRDGLIFDFAWSRGGKQLALSRGLINSDVVLISNFK